MLLLLPLQLLRLLLLRQLSSLLQLLPRAHVIPTNPSSDVIVYFPPFRLEVLVFVLHRGLVMMMRTLQSSGRPMLSVLLLMMWTVIKTINRTASAADRECWRLEVTKPILRSLHLPHPAAELLLLVLILVLLLVRHGRDEGRSRECAGRGSAGRGRHQRSRREFGVDSGFSLRGRRVYIILVIPAPSLEGDTPPPSSSSSSSSSDAPRVCVLGAGETKAIRHFPLGCVVHPGTQQTLQHHPRRDLLLTGLPPLVARLHARWTPGGARTVAHRLQRLLPQP